MTAQIFSFSGNTLCELAADDVIEAAKEKLDTVLVIGWTKEDELYVASSTSQTGEIFLLMEVAKASLLRKMLDGD